jgi:hypothetical protein
VSTALIPFQEVRGMAEAIARSGLFGMKTPDQALALMLVAQAEGQHPATITQEYDIIQGRAARKTHSVLARFQSAGGSVQWHELTDAIADATFSHKAGGSLRMTWTFEQATKAGLTGKDNWKNYPRAMLRARCIAEGVRAVYPAALGGMLVSEEVQDMPASDMPIKTIDQQTGEIKPAARPELPPYAQADFDKNLPQWRGIVQAGRKTPDELIAMVGTKGVLSDAMKQAIRDLAKPQDVTDVQPKGETVAPLTRATTANESPSGADDSDLPWED